MADISIILFVIGLIAGFVIAYFLIHKIIKMKYKVEFAKWKLTSEGEIRSDALTRSRAVLKGKIGEQIAAILPEFKYNPADARFIGNPIDYIIFDGYSEGKDINIVLLDVKKGKYAKLSKPQTEIKRAVDAKRIKWKTLNLE